MNKKVLNVLIACEESQAETSAFRELGHNAYSCDIEECRKGGHPEWHIHQDVIPLLYGKKKFKTQDGRYHTVKSWDLVIAHPPCTYLCKVGSPWLYKEPLQSCVVDNKIIQANWDRVEKMKQGREFFYKCLNAPIKYLAVENPIPMKLAGLPKPSFYACPSWFGVKYTKKTCYWVKNLPPIVAQNIYPNPKCFVTASRGKYRSRTFPQLAMGIAKQWSQFILDELAHNK